MNAMAECWPLRLNVCKSLETVRRGRTHGSFSCPSGNSPSVAPAESKPYVQQQEIWHCLEIEKWAHIVRPYGRKNSLPFLCSLSSENFAVLF